MQVLVKPQTPRKLFRGDWVIIIPGLSLKCSVTTLQARQVVLKKYFFCRAKSPDRYRLCMRIKPAADSLRLETEIRWKHSLRLRQSKPPNYTGDFVTRPATTQTLKAQLICLNGVNFFNYTRSISIEAPFFSTVRVVRTRKECYSRSFSILPGHTPGIWVLFLSGIACERRRIPSISGRADYLIPCGLINHGGDGEDDGDKLWWIQRKRLPIRDRLVENQRPT